MKFSGEDTDNDHSDKITDQQKKAESKKKEPKPSKEDLINLLEIDIIALQRENPDFTWEYINKEYGIKELSDLDGVKYKKLRIEVDRLLA